MSLPGGRAIQHSIDTTIRLTAQTIAGIQPKLHLYVRKNRSSELKVVMMNRLQLCQAADFRVIILTPGNNWAMMGDGWSLEAEPGNWVRRARGVPQLGAIDDNGNDAFGRKVDCTPEGMVISSTRDFKSDRMEFLIHWFR